MTVEVPVAVVADTRVVVSVRVVGGSVVVTVTVIVVHSPSSQAVSVDVGCVFVVV